MVTKNIMLMITSADVERAKTSGTTQIVNGQSLIKVNDGGRAVLQDDGTYAYLVQVYYNP